MQKVIALFGSPGSGKTTLAYSLACKMAIDKKMNVSIVSVDRTVPQANNLFPMMESSPDKSLGAILLEQPTERMIAEKLLISPKIPRLGLLSFQSGDTQTMYPPAPDKDRYRTVLNLLFRQSDCILLDCTSDPITNSLTLASLELADRVFVTYTPDHISLEWRKSVYPLLKDPRFRTEQHIQFLSPVHPFSPIGELKQALGDVKFQLPFSTEVMESRISGLPLTNPGTKSGFVYHKELDRLLTEVVFQ